MTKQECSRCGENICEECTFKGTLFCKNCPATICNGCLRGRKFADFGERNRTCPYCGQKDVTDEHLENELKKHDLLMRKNRK